MVSVEQEIAHMRNCLASAKSRHRSRSSQINMSRAIAKGEASHGQANQSVPGYLAVRRSSIPNAGRGVFAQVGFRAGDAVVLCTGTFVKASTQTAPQMRYSFTIPGHPRVALQCYSDGETNIVKYINSAHGTNRAQNVELRWHGCMLIAYALTDIRNGDELLQNYTF